MARYPFEETVRVHLVPTIANIAAPTVAEINAGTDVTCFLTRDGLQPGGTTNKVDTAGLCTRVDGQVVGSVSYDFTLKLFRDDAADTAWDLAVWGTDTHIVARRGVAYATAFAATQDVEVYAGQLGEPVMAASATNTPQTFDVTFAVSAANLKAIVAA